MAVRKTWTTKGGGRREAWLVDYFDREGERHSETFESTMHYGFPTAHMR